MTTKKICFNKKFHLYLPVNINPKNMILQELINIIKNNNNVNIYTFSKNFKNNFVDNTVNIWHYNNKVVKLSYKKKSI